MKENLRLRKELEEAKKRIYSQKSSGILCKENRLEAYRFIEQHHIEFGRCWFLRRLEICPNAYYNYLKRRKADCYTCKSEVQNQIKEDLPLAQGSRWLPQHESLSGT